MMEKAEISGQQFDTIDFTLHPPAMGEYDDCSFINCNFSNVSLYNCTFAGCSFTGCNMSLANLASTILRDVQFRDCKLLGLHFEYCKPMLFSVGFEQCILNLSCFYQLNLRQTKFVNCSLHEADFSAADLSAALFDRCDLHAAVFDGTNLEKADFRTAYNYAIDPEKNRIKKAMFSQDGLAGLLGKYGIVIE